MYIFLMWLYKKMEDSHYAKINQYNVFGRKRKQYNNFRNRLLDIFSMDGLFSHYKPHYVVEYHGVK